jgi:hypothetical protein
MRVRSSANGLCAAWNGKSAICRWCIRNAESDQLPAAKTSNLFYWDTLLPVRAGHAESVVVALLLCSLHRLSYYDSRKSTMFFALWLSCSSAVFLSHVNVCALLVRMAGTGSGASRAAHTSLRKYGNACLALVAPPF